jgi:ABC-type transport system involved in multi-copper enzyme maturation permease subunit
MRGITRDTVVELVDRKMLWLFGLVTAVILLIVYASGGVRAEFSAGGGTTSFEGLPPSTVSWIIGRVMSFLVFLTVLATAGLFPRMFERGRAEFYLSKPGSRTSLLMGKFAAVWFIYGLMVFTCGVLIYGATAIVHHTFDFDIIYLFIVYLGLLFVWLSVVAFAGIAFNSTVLAIISAFVVWVLQTVLAYHEALQALIGPGLLSNLVKILYYIVPKAGEMSDMAVNLGSGHRVLNWMPLWTSLIFGVAMVYLAVVIFRRRNY